MAYLNEYVEKIRQLGVATFRSRHGTPVLLVLGLSGELGDGTGDGRTLPARVEGLEESLALADRVFPLVRASGLADPRKPLYVGRTVDNDVVINEYSISARHCFFVVTATGLVLHDCRSKNGTWVNKVRLAAGAPAPIADGTDIRLGRFLFKYYSADGFLGRVMQAAGLTKK